MLFFFFLMIRRPPRSTLFPYTTLFRSWDREHSFPRELFTKLAELGLMGACVPEEYGGAGVDFLSYILVLEELSRAEDRKSTRLNSSHLVISYAVFCLKKKKTIAEELGTLRDDMLYRVPRQPFASQDDETLHSPPRYSCALPPRT